MGFDCDTNLGGVDLKDKMLQPYLLECKKGNKWCITFFKRLLNVAIHSTVVLFGTTTGSQKLIIWVEIVIHQKPCRITWADIAMASVLSRLYWTSTKKGYRMALLGEYSCFWKKGQTTKGMCYICQKKQKESTCWFSDCQVGLCLEKCFRIYHRKLNF